MAKWLKDFPNNFRNGANKTRATSNTDTQAFEKQERTVSTGPKTNGSWGSLRKGSGAGCRSSSGGMSSLLSGRNRKNSANESCLTVTKDEKTWVNLLSGKSKKISKSIVGSEERQTQKTPTPARTHISRLIKVEKQENVGNSNNRCSNLTEESDAAITGKTKTVIIREDYADPFDAQEASRRQVTQPWSAENDGYMEPYDAQQLMTEIRRRGSKDLLKMSTVLEGGEETKDDSSPSSPRALIYTDPYEGGVDTPTMRLEPDSWSTAEGELPWDWGREKILKALSVPLDNARCLDPSYPSRDEALHLSWPQAQHLQPWTWSQKTLRKAMVGRTIVLECDTNRVDPKLPLERQSWYHGNVTRQEVDAQLQSCKEGSFLVRDSESGTSKYSIALKTSQGCVHIIVAQTKENGYTLDQSRCTFPSIPQVVHYYCGMPLPFPGANHMTLKYPVPRLTLSHDKSAAI